MSQPGLVAITGMHRSGTSLGTRIIQLAGVSLGRDDGIAPPGRDNPAGYWENRYVTELNDEILAALGGSWDQPPVLDPGWELDPALEPYRERIGEVVDTYYSSTANDRPIGCKDPRLSILLPLWRTVIDIPTTIVIVRSPYEVAASLHARNQMPHAQASLLWLRYVVCATRQDPGHLLVTHPDLLGDLRSTLLRITSHLGLPPVDDTIERQAHDHIDPDLRHHTDTTQPSPPTDPITKLAAAVWNDGNLCWESLGVGTADAIATGWLRPPTDTAALTTARAKVVELQETIRRRNRRERAEAAARSATQEHRQPSVS